MMVVVAAAVTGTASEKVSGKIELAYY